MIRLLQLIALILIFTFISACKNSELDYNEKEMAFLRELDSPISYIDTTLLEQTETTVETYFKNLSDIFKKQKVDIKFVLDKQLKTKQLPKKSELFTTGQTFFKDMTVGDIMLYSCNTLGLKWTVYPDRKVIHIEETREEKIRVAFFKEFNEKTIRLDTAQYPSHVSEFPVYFNMLEKQFAEKDFEVEFILDDSIKALIEKFPPIEDKKKLDRFPVGTIGQRYWEMGLNDAVAYSCAAYQLRYFVNVERKEVLIKLDPIYKGLEEKYYEDVFNMDDEFNDDFEDDDFEEE